LAIGQKLIGLSAFTGLIESLLPAKGIFKVVRIGIGLWYVSTLFSEISVILLPGRG
jgi:hypothetical protein